MFEQDYPSDIRRYTILTGTQRDARWSARHARLLQLAETLEQLSLYNESYFPMMAARLLSPEDVLLLHDVAARAEVDSDHRVRALSVPLRRGAAVIDATLAGLERTEHESRRRPA